MDSQNFKKQLQNQTPICSYFIQRKKRQCKFNVMPGSKYCQSHCSDLQSKIKCPYEKGTYIDVANYQKHLLNCPKIKQNKKTENSNWYKKNINQNKIKQHEQKNKESQNKDKLQIDSKYQLSSVSNQQLESIISKIIEIFNKVFIGNQQSFIQSSPIQQTPQTVDTNDHKQAYLITQTAFKHKLISPKIIYIQFGAGKGILSYAFAKKIQNSFHIYSKNILLQRQSRRNKFDKHFRQNPYFQRYKSDVSDFSMINIGQTMVGYIKEKNKQQKRIQQLRNKKNNKVQLISNEQQKIEMQKDSIISKKQKKLIKKSQKQHQIQNYQQNLTFESKKQNQTLNQVKLQQQLQDIQNAQKTLSNYPIVGICKHMCGLALDISVRGLLKGKIGGCVLASCCHHLCTYDSFLNNEFFKNFGLSGQQIQLLFKISSWGTKSSLIQFKQECFKDVIKNLKNKNISEMKQNDKVIIGRMCKRLIDKARSEYLNGQLIRYCSDQLTPQNYVIISNKLEC